MTKVELEQQVADLRLANKDLKEENESVKDAQLLGMQKDWLDLEANQGMAIRRVTPTTGKNGNPDGLDIPSGCRIGGQGQLQLDIVTDLSLSKDQVEAVKKGSTNLTAYVFSRRLNIYLYASRKTTGKQTRVLGVYVNEGDVSMKYNVKVLASEHHRGLDFKEDEEGVQTPA
jgi:hypothetical protein